VKRYEFLFTHFSDEFSDRELESIIPDDILSFLTKITDRNKQTIKRNRYSSLKAFFNFIKNSIDIKIQNPCDTPILRKIFKDSKSPPWPIIEKELVLMSAGLLWQVRQSGRTRPFWFASNTEPHCFLRS
jgi:hypothetical protein